MSTQAPGWYHDPMSSIRQFRYFDGQRWTEQTAPLPVNGMMPGNSFFGRLFAGRRSLSAR